MATTLPKEATQLPDPVVEATKKNIEDYDKQAEQTKEMQAQKQAALEPLQQQRQQAGQGYQQMLEKGPEQVAMPVNEAKHIDHQTLTDSAGSMMALAGLVGAMLGAPITVALRGMTGAMKGAQEADEEQFKEGVAKYKQNMDEAITMNQQKLDAYNRILKGKEFNIREMDAQLQTVAAQFDDKIMMAAKTFKDKMDLVTANANAMQNAQKHKTDMEHWAADYQLRLNKDKREAAAAGGGAGGPASGLEAATSAFLVGGVHPPKDQYMNVMRNVEAIAKSNNMTTDELMAASVDVRSQAMAKRSFEIRAQNMMRAENQLNQEIPVMEKAMEKIAPINSPMAASLDLWRIRNGAGTKEQREAVAQLDQAAEVVFNEFEGIVTGNPGALNVSDVQNAHAQYDRAKAPTEMRAVIDGMKRIIANAKVAGAETRKEITGGMVNALHGRGEQPAGEGAKPQATAKDNEAVAWAKAHPNDPRAAKILKANGM